MSPPVICQQDWDALTAEYGRVAGQLLVYQRVVSEKDAEIERLRVEVARLSDQLYRESDRGGGA